MPPVYALTGQLAAGKSSLAAALAASFPFGIHIDIDAIRELVVGGLASPLEWSDETTRQFDLAIEGSVALASVYHRAGFAVVIEGTVDPVALDRALEASEMSSAGIGIQLLPPLEVALARNRARTTKPFEAAVLEDVIHRLDADMRAGSLPAGWTRIDNGAESLEDTLGRLRALTDEEGPRHLGEG